MSSGSAEARSGCANSSGSRSSAILVVRANAIATRSLNFLFSAVQPRARWSNRVGLYESIKSETKSARSHSGLISQNVLWRGSPFRPHAVGQRSMGHEMLIIDTPRVCRSQGGRFDINIALERLKRAPLKPLSPISGDVYIFVIRWTSPRHRCHPRVGRRQGGLELRQAWRHVRG